MLSTGYQTKCKRHGCGFTVAEMLIALAITAVLTAAIAVAFHASIINYNINEQLFEAVNSGRQALIRITNQLRTADAVDPAAGTAECALITSGGENITYRYDSTDGRLYLDKAGSSYVLCENVAAMSFTKQTGIEDGITYVKSVQISLTVSVENTQRTLSAASVIRRNLD